MSSTDAEPPVTPAVDAREQVRMRVSDTQVDEAWTNVSARLGPHQATRTRRRVAFVAATASCAVAAAMLLLAKAPPSQPAQKPLAVSSPVTPAPPYAIELLRDGRVAAVSADTNATVHRLERGSARFTVSPCSSDCQQDPEFVVLAANVRVVLAADARMDGAGAQFEVGLEEDEQGPAAVDVWVVRGRVAVEHAASAQSMGAGEHRRIALRARPALERAESPRANRKARKRPPAKRPAPAGKEDARALFARAREADRTGDFATARAQYEKLLRAFPKDPRAGLAAYEIGRILMDRKGDLAGAARQLERSLRIAPKGPIADDATARLVRLYERRGQSKRCHELRARYLREFPAGRHRQEVARRCP